MYYKAPRAHLLEGSPKTVVKIDGKKGKFFSIIVKLSLRCSKQDDMLICRTPGLHSFMKNFTMSAKQLRMTQKLFSIRGKEPKDQRSIRGCEAEEGQHQWGATLF